MMMKMGVIHLLHAKVMTHTFSTVLALYRLETPKQVHLQTVKTQMKCRKMRHFIRVYTNGKGEKDLQTKEYKKIHQDLHCMLRQN